MSNAPSEILVFRVSPGRPRPGSWTTVEDGVIGWTPESSARGLGVDRFWANWVSELPVGTRCVFTVDSVVVGDFVLMDATASRFGTILDLEPHGGLSTLMGEYLPTPPGGDTSTPVWVTR